MSIVSISTTFDLGDWDLSTMRFGVIRAVDIWRLDSERKKAFKEDWKQMLEKITSVPWDHDINRLRDAMASVLRKYRVTWIDPRSEIQSPWNCASRWFVLGFWIFFAMGWTVTKFFYYYFGF
ncbi:uncharacterized protein LAJ45_07794 [Morchella importuna]|uniref:uncharacterized protein n=1 Tax=Morchella importuna TaxID=1174673 RepID=UPI001E8D854F|nr:uncharacterized protein LAJ45_07794 [Morchella importuna]KAH8148030.1 hypothetical protein LAJ45_07794 [Morchella importuna]